MSKPTPQIPKDWHHLTGLYEAAMLKDKETISALQEEVNELRQKLKNSHRVPKKEIEAMRKKKNYRGKGKSRNATAFDCLIKEKGEWI